ncbi:MAG TPA: hypothetical protein PKK10_01165 [Woeseiaceae bacterium]|nr:hypothetical protein [Woeseiaceae bacterium]
MHKLQHAATEAPENVVLEMSEHMTTLAQAGDWEEIERLAIRLRSVFTNVPEGHRRGLVDALQHRLATVTQEARKAHKDVSRELGQLRRGQVAAKAYELR